MIPQVKEIFDKFREKSIEENKTKLFDVIENRIREVEGEYLVYYISFKKKLKYFKICKCASTSLIECLTQQIDFIPIYESNAQHIDNIKDYNNFAVIRNPKSRWISGLNEFMTSIYGGEVKLKSYIENELKNNRFIFDGHTLPQINYLPSRSHNMTLLRLDKNLNQKISSLLGEDVQLKYKNTISADMNKKTNLNFCETMFKTYCEKNPKYYQTYEFDHRLFNISK